MIPGLANLAVSAISCGKRHLTAVVEQGSAYTFGDDSYPFVLFTHNSLVLDQKIQIFYKLTLCKTVCLFIVNFWYSVCNFCVWLHKYLAELLCVSGMISLLIVMKGVCTLD